jgi:hypothetical protein
MAKPSKQAGKNLDEFAGQHSRLAQRDRDRLEATIREHSATIRRLGQELHAAEDIRHAIFGLAEHDLATPKWIEQSKPAKGKVPSIPVVMISDEQVGERILAEEIEGINHYDHNEYVKRHDLMVQKVVEISKEHMRGLQFPCAIVGFLGDAINGEIHAELAETNSLQSVPSTALVVETRRNAIDFLLRHFERLFIVIIPGNHGRTTPKPRFKKYATMNYEALIGWWLQSLYKNEPRVKIVVPPSGDFHMMVWGKGLFFTHGDRLGAMSGGGSGMGFAGPALPIIRGSRNVREQQTAMGRQIDYIHIGHWHTRLELAGTWANGAMAGYNEYAHGLRYRPAPAEQWLYYLHPTHGATARWPIFLSPQPRAHVRTDDEKWMVPA